MSKQHTNRVIKPVNGVGPGWTSGAKRVIQERDALHRLGYDRVTRVTVEAEPISQMLCATDSRSEVDLTIWTAI